MPPTRNCCSARHGPVLDVGCGPGRLTIALTERGVPALGVDISRAAIDLVRQAGAPALHRSVFDPLPGRGRWATVLLADGNIGIGGLPARLLRRCAQLLAPGGRILIEAEPGAVDERVTAWLEHPDGRRGPVFPWAHLGTAAVLDAAAAAGLRVVGNGTTRAARSSPWPGSRLPVVQPASRVPARPTMINLVTSSGVVLAGHGRDRDGRLALRAPRRPAR